MATISETWKSTIGGAIFMRRPDGKERRIAGGQQFQISPDDRASHQSQCTPGNDPFTNGKFARVRPRSQTRARSGTPAASAAAAPSAPAEVEPEPAEITAEDGAPDPEESPVDIIETDADLAAVPDEDDDVISEAQLVEILDQHHATLKKTLAGIESQVLLRRLRTLGQVQGTSAGKMKHINDRVAELTGSPAVRRADRVGSVGAGSDGIDHGALEGDHEPTAGGGSPLSD